MTKTWTFDSAEDIVSVLRGIADEIECGILKFENKEVHNVMSGIEDIVVKEAEGDNN